MNRTPEQVREEADRLLNSDILNEALDRLRKNALADLLRASGPEGDTIRREKADFIRAIDALPAALKQEMLNATQVARPRASVA